MIRHFNGDLLQCGCQIICHQVNLQGIMGGGLALQVAALYPNTNKTYKNYNNKNLGAVCISKENCFYIANCFTQDCEFNTDYNAIRTAFLQIIDFCKTAKIKTIGIPFNYGCGIANGDWNKVYAIFEELFADSEIELQIWRFEN